MSKRILLTGANGFVGSHILSQLLSANHSVRAVVRSQTKASQVASDFPSFSQPQFDFGIVPDITAPGAFNDVVLSSPPFDVLIHTASPFLYRVISSNSEFLDPALKGTLEVLKAVKAFAPSVKRVVLTSSCAAVVDFTAPFTSVPKKVYTEEDWNPTTWEGALSGSQNNAYQASKKFAEMAAWDFVKNEKPNFDLVTLAPPMIYGPLRNSIQSVKQLNESTARIYNLFINSSADADLPPSGLHIYTDVRDVALAHVKAATIPEAGGQRFIICAGPISSQEISDMLRAKIPELEKRTPKGTPGTKIDERLFTASSGKAGRILELRYRSKEETFVELARQLLEAEKKEAQ